MQNKQYDFTNKAIKCEDQTELLKLVELVEHTGCNVMIDPNHVEDKPYFRMSIGGDFFGNFRHVKKDIHEVVSFSDFISQQPEKPELVAGMWVRCVSDEWDCATLDKWYKVVDFTSETVLVVDDNSEHTRFLNHNFDLINPSPTDPNEVIKDSGESERTIQWTSNYNSKEPARSPAHVYDPVASMNIGSVCTAKVKEKVHVWTDSDLHAAFRAGIASHEDKISFPSWIKEWKEIQ